MLIKELLDERDGFKWYDLHSDTEGKAVLQVETGIIYGGVAMREDDPHTYEECDDPNYVTEEGSDEEYDYAEAARIILFGE